MNFTQTQNDHIWRPHWVFIDLRHDFRWWSKIWFKSQTCIRNDALVSRSYIALVINYLEIPKWSYLETPRGINWPSAWFSMMIKDLIQITTLHQKWHFGVKVIHRTCHQLLRNPKMIIFGDPMGYSLTFGMIFDDDQRFDLNHYHDFLVLKYS